MASIRRKFTKRVTGSPTTPRLRSTGRRRPALRKESQPDWRQTLTTLSGIASVLLVAVGLFYTNTANRSQRQLTERGQVTERFTRAIDQLGSKDVDVRLGGIYGLERLMRDSPSDQPNIIEVLSAYVRLHAAVSTATASPSVGTGPQPAGLATDVQAGLTVLGRLPSSTDKSTIDLRDAHLAGADLTSANLSRANLSGATLTWATIANSDLSGANLSGADLSNADLTSANLNEAKLINADLRDATLENANLSGSKLNFANLAGENLQTSME